MLGTPPDACKGDEEVSKPATDPLCTDPRPARDAINTQVAATPGPSSPRSPEPWLAGLLTADFFQPCPHHAIGASTAKNVGNYFCEVCTPAAGRGMCAACLPGHAASCGCRPHQGFQIRRYMYQNVVHAEDLSKRYNIAGIQQYSINDRKAVLIKPKTAPATAKTAPAFNNHCRGCAVPLNPECLFCSLQCKVTVDFGLSIPYTLSTPYIEACDDAPTAVATATPGRRVRPASGVAFSDARSSGARSSGGVASDARCAPSGCKRRKRMSPERSHVM